MHRRKAMLGNRNFLPVYKEGDGRHLNDLVPSVVGIEDGVQHYGAIRIANQKELIDSMVCLPLCGVCGLSRRMPQT